MKRLTAAVMVLAVVGSMAPIRLAAAPAVTTGWIRGAVIENNGRPSRTSLRVQLVNSRGVPVPGKVSSVASDGAYSLMNVDPGTYTIEVLGASGSTSVNVTADRVSTANITLPSAQATGAGMSTTAKWLIGLAIAGGGAAVVAVVATKNDASGSK